MNSVTSQIVSRKSRHLDWTLLSFLILINLLQNTVFGIHIKGLLGNYGLPFIVWLLLTAFTLWLPRVRSRSKLRHRKLTLWLALMCLLISVLATLLQGAISGFGRSPYDHSLLGIVINVAVLGAGITGIELSRAWFMNRRFNNRPYMGIPLLSLFFTLFYFPWNRFTGISTMLNAVTFLGSEFLPALAQNLLCTYLAFLGGPLPAMLYRGGLTAAERLSPTLPLNNWVSQTLVGILAPVLGMILVRQIFMEENRMIKRNRDAEGLWGWTMTSVSAILIMWFAMGVFSYAPRVILSGSMQPEINIGDVVIIHRIPVEKVPEEVQVGDIIMFPQNNMKVTHRVIKAYQVYGNNYYVTKGDANPDPEKEPVPQGNVQGKVVMTIPKIGWLTLVLKGAVY
ncbi:MAG: signal peptidase I [Bacillota bacterium]